MHWKTVSVHLWYSDRIPEIQCLASMWNGSTHSCVVTLCLSPQSVAVWRLWNPRDVGYLCWYHWRWDLKAIPTSGSGLSYAHVSTTMWGVTHCDWSVQLCLSTLGTVPSDPTSWNNPFFSDFASFRCFCHNNEKIQNTPSKNQVTAGRNR